ncbi:MAG: ABC transporter ATP-binding protein [Firmicutes bacterium]|nr:ABC transporter ATP-binding protein [Bacillota bacterium]
MTSAIALANVIFRYRQGGFTLSCPKLDFFPGELSLITGANGSGKTTLSQLMCGILQPSQGEVRIFGKSAANLSLGQIGSQVGYLFQNPARQLFSGTVWKEMTLVDELLGRDSKSAACKASRLLEDFGLGHLQERSTYYLSGGEKQRLALCTLLMGGARFLILDEPTVGLDKPNRQILYSVIDSLLAEGRGLAVITHEAELIRRYPQAGRIQVDKGQVAS